MKNFGLLLYHLSSDSVCVPSKSACQVQMWFLSFGDLGTTKTGFSISFCFWIDGNGGKKDRIRAADMLIWRAKSADSEQSLSCASSGIPLIGHCEWQIASLTHWAVTLFCGGKFCLWVFSGCAHFLLFFTGSEVGTGGIFSPWGLNSFPAYFCLEGWRFKTGFKSNAFLVKVLVSLAIHSLKSVLLVYLLTKFYVPITSLFWNLVLRSALFLCFFMPMPWFLFLWNALKLLNLNWKIIPLIWLFLEAL